MPDADERQRVLRTYRSYLASPVKARAWSDSNPGNIAIRSELAEAVFALAGAELTGAARILDVGCGSGWWLERLAADARVPARLDGLDLLPQRVAAARRRVAAASIAEGDACELPYADGTYDVVSLFTVLSSLGSGERVKRALQEASRVLTPTGCILVWEPRTPNPLNRNTQLIGRHQLVAALGPSTIDTRTTTVFPPLARHLGPWTRRLYPVLLQMSALRTHRLARVRLLAA